MRLDNTSKPMRWWIPIAAIITAWALVFVASCGSKPSEPVSPPSPAPTPNAKHYVLSSLTYEDVVPGQYAAKLKSFTGGPAYIDFAEGGVGKVGAYSNVSGTMEITFPDNTVQTQAVLILPQGYGNFAYTVNTATNLVTFLNGPSVWPLQQNSTLTDLEYSFSDKHCYDEACSNYELLAFTWTRSQ